MLELASSPWIYAVVVAALAVDAVLPVVPSETLVIGLAALRPDHPVALAAAVVAGGLAGDCLAYGIGRRAPGRLRAARAVTALRRYGAVAVLVGRFLPGGRTATTMAAGASGLPVGRFRLASLLAGAAWAAYAIGLGRLGGAVFQEQPLLGAGVGIAFGLLTGAVFHLVTRRRTAGSALAAVPARVAAVDHHEPAAAAGQHRSRLALERAK